MASATSPSRSSTSSCSASTSSTCRAEDYGVLGSSAASRSWPRSSSASASTGRSCGSSTTADDEEERQRLASTIFFFLLAVERRRRSSCCSLAAPRARARDVLGGRTHTHRPAAHAAEHVRDRVHVHPVPRAAHRAADGDLQPADARAVGPDDRPPPGARRRLYMAVVGRRPRGRRRDDRR